MRIPIYFCPVRPALGPSRPKVPRPRAKRAALQGSYGKHGLCRINFLCAAASSVPV